MNEHIAQIDRDPAETTTTRQLVGFIIGEEMFGVDILTVREIIRDAVITAIPDAPDFLEGVINLRGSIIPVIDLRKRLKLAPSARSGDDGWIVILVVQGRITGFVVDRVTKVLHVPESSIKPPPDIVVAGLRSQYIQGVCRMDQRLLILLDFSRILMVDEIKQLQSMQRPTV
ncbi:MAG: chemotaxis protein CheW [Desulfosarcina sp.]